MSSILNQEGAWEEGGGVLPHKRMMPKRKRKFGKGATRGGDQNSSRSDTTPVERHAELAVPGYAATASDRVSSDSAAVVKRLNKKQLQIRLSCNTNKLKCAEKLVRTTQKKLVTTKEHYKQLASLAQEKRKDS